MQYSRLFDNDLIALGILHTIDDRSNLDLIKKIRFFGQSKKLAQALIDQIDQY